MLTRGGQQRRTIGTVLAVTGWLLAVLGGFGLLTRHAARPGAAADAPLRWPTGSTIPRIPGRATIVMVAHAQCPCTRAALRELERLMTSAAAHADAWVVMTGESGAWVDLRAMVRGMSTIHLVADADAAHVFGPKTSGQVVVYDANGALLFSGGITASRGHEGDSDGRARILEALSDGPHPTLSSRAAVFGCSLLGVKDPS